MSADTLRIAVAQVAPAWLDRAATLQRVAARIGEAAAGGGRLAVFGEALVPGYPFWVEHTDGARFESPLQRALFAHYADQAVSIERGDLDAVCAAARAGGIAVMLGIIERPLDRGGHSLYCSLVYVDAAGRIGAVHRKLVPTYEERLVWAPGDGHGLRTHRLGAFTLGGLNCWENWMPLSRAALYAQGEDLHVALWPGNPRNTVEITRWLARESRSYVVSVCGLLDRADIGDVVPESAALRAALPAQPAAGGSCIAGPDGAWLLEPVVAREALLWADLDHAQVRRARHDFDPAGHYARPDVTRLVVDRRRLGIAEFDDGTE